MLSLQAQALTDAAIAGDLVQVEATLRIMEGQPRSESVIKDFDPANAFLMASAFDRSQVIELLHRRLPWVTFPLGYALALAATNDRKLAVQTLLALGADPEKDQAVGLRRALEKGYQAIIEMLAPRVDVAALGDFLIADEAWPSLDRLSPYAPVKVQNEWRKQRGPDLLPWLHGQAQAQARSDQLMKIQASSMSPSPRRRS